MTSIRTGGTPIANDLVSLKEQTLGDILLRHAKITKHYSCLLRIGFAHRNPDVHISGRTGITVAPYGIATNKQVLNCVRVQKSQEIFEVWM